MNTSDRKSKRRKAKRTNIISFGRGKTARRRKRIFKEIVKYLP